ncbi:MAG: M23/M56 family metallopeptidase [Pseudomonadota bacterium]|nr:M23/M56 family metallopeptidase [Pseudomonadota bacterium]
MSAAELMALQFMQASLACVLAGGGVWALLALACRRWPALALSRRAWLLAQLLTVAAFLCVLAPQAAQLSVMPPIALDAQPLSPAAPAAPAAAPVTPAAVTAAPADTGEPSGVWLLRAAQAWLAVYLVGVSVAAIRLALAQRALRRLVHAATRLTDPAAHDGFDAMPAIAVYEIDLAVSPMLIGVWRPRLLLPRHLRQFDGAQQRMIVDHELTHLRRHDPLWMAASIAARTLLWFNPAMRRLAERLRWAQELSCDRQVLAGRPQPQRKAYAAALLGQLKIEHGGFAAALAFGGTGPASMGARMLLIRQGCAQAPGALIGSALATGFGAVFAASLLLQPAFAWRLPGVPSSAPAAPVAWQAPLAQARVSSFFGVVSPLRPNGHRGVDFVTHTGTAVLASADGRVVTSADLDAGGAKFGKTVLIVHANGLSSFYAHLDSRLVAAGDIVKAGQVIGLSGATGRVTGPHLHFEVRQGDRIVNPATVLAGLDAHATASALRNRARLAGR